jgi:hypothetical protein
MLCKDVFSTPALHRQYDIFLSEKKQESRVADLSDMIRMACDTGGIYIGQLLAILEKGRALGEPMAGILDRVSAVSAKRGVANNVAGGIDFEKGISCACGKANRPLAENCSTCKKLLYRPCPQCAKAHPVDALSCACGFSLVDILFRLNSALQGGRAQEALGLWNEAYRGHPAFQKAGKDIDALRKMADDLRRQADAEKDTVSRLVAAIRAKDGNTSASLWDDKYKSHPAFKDHLDALRDACRPVDVEGVTASNRGGFIHVQWNLPKGINRFALTWSPKGFQGYVAGNQALRLGLSEYHRDGARIPIASPGILHITVFCFSYFMGEELASPGTGAGCRPIRS